MIQITAIGSCAVLLLFQGNGWGKEQLLPFSASSKLKLVPFWFNYVWCGQGCMKYFCEKITCDLENWLHPWRMSKAAILLALRRQVAIRFDSSFFASSRPVKTGNGPFSLELSIWSKGKMKLVLITNQRKLSFGKLPPFESSLGANRKEKKTNGTFCVFRKVGTRAKTNYIQFGFAPSRKRVASSLVQRRIISSDDLFGSFRVKVILLWFRMFIPAVLRVGM